MENINGIVLQSVGRNNWIKKAIVTGTWSKSWLAGDVKEVLKSIQELKEMYPHLNLANARVEFIELDDVDNEFEEVDGEEE